MRPQQWICVVEGEIPRRSWAAQLKEEAGFMMFEYAEEIERLADIKVTGVGGAGGIASGGDSSIARPSV